MTDAPDFMYTGTCVYSDPARDVFVVPDGRIMLVDSFFPDGESLYTAPPSMLADFLIAIAATLERQGVKIVWDGKDATP